MHLPRVYADFNAITYNQEGGSLAELALTGYGTLSSFAQQGLRLEEGLHVLLYEPNDIECEAVIHFDTTRQDPAGRTGEWVARIDHRNIRDSKETKQPGLTFPCLVCGSIFSSGAAGLGGNYQENCLHCGASVMEPLSPPKNAA